jgi:hypothetical protein
MAYACPRCNGVVRRGTSRGAMIIFGLAGGLIGGVAAAMVSYVLGSMHCERCGAIPKKEFSSEDRMEMFVGSLAILGIGAFMLVGAIYLLTMLRHH